MHAKAPGHTPSSTCPFLPAACCFLPSPFCLLFCLLALPFSIIVCWLTYICIVCRGILLKITLLAAGFVIGKFQTNETASKHSIAQHLVKLVLYALLTHLARSWLHMSCSAVSIQPTRSNTKKLCSVGRPCQCVQVWYASCQCVQV